LVRGSVATATAGAGVSLLRLLIGRMLLVESASLRWVCPGKGRNAGDPVVIGGDFVRMDRKGGQMVVSAVLSVRAGTALNDEVRARNTLAW